VSSGTIHDVRALPHCHGDVGQSERRAVVDSIADDGHLRAAFLELPNGVSFALGGYSRSPLVQAERFDDVPARPSLSPDGSIFEGRAAAT